MTEAEALAAGADAVLRKPNEVQAIAEALKMQLRKKSQ
jgi:CheY-like chemotaxis protein